MNNRRDISEWLPTTAKEVKALEWDELDVILFTGDAYVDHPSFGAAVIGRILEAQGLKVAIVPQPNWKDDLRDFKKLGAPRLFFGVSAGAMDSMVNHYTANKRLRSDDAYTPGGKAGFRPDYPTIVYTQALKKLFPDVPVVIGGIEASLRRVSHYDYWQNSVQPSILQSSGADMLVYGMGEKPLLEIVELLEKGVPFSSLRTIPQTVIKQPIEQELPKQNSWKNLELHSYEDCLADKAKYAQNFKHLEEESNRWEANRLYQKSGDNTIIVNPPYPPMNEAEIDASFDLPYTRLPHPKYHNKGVIPAFEMIKFSVNMHRGCFGGCSFCTISAHQGKFVASRSKKSIISEVREIIKQDDFKGNLSDLGGPSANMYKLGGKDLSICKMCKRPSCLTPKVCNNLNTDPSAIIDIYQTVEKIQGIKKAFVGSGIRYDLFLGEDGYLEPKEKNSQYFKELVTKHVSGRLKIAPEHTSERVLKLMRKPSFKLFKPLKSEFEKLNQQAGMNQQLIPYFISSHPGSQEEDMAQLAVETKNLNFQLEQVQDFTPTPMTLATVIYYTGINPYTNEKVFTAQSKEEKLNQRMFFFWYKSEFRQNIINRLKKMNRNDLVSKLFDNKKVNSAFNSNPKNFTK